MADVNLGQLTSTTLSNYHKEFSDNIFKKYALLDHLKNNGGTKMYDGGANIRVPIMYGKNTSVQRFKGVDTLDTTYQEGIDAAQYDYKFYNVSIVYTLTDSLMNKGKEQVLNLLEGKIKQAENSLSEFINGDMIAGTDTKGILGLDTAVAASGTYGSINGTTYTWWRSHVESTGEVLGFARIRTAKNTANLGQGGSNVSFIMTTQTLYEKLFALLTATYQFNPVGKETKRLADGSFSVLEFEGVPVGFDEQETAGEMHLINKDNYKLGILTGADFQEIKKADPANQHINVNDIVFGGSEVVNRRASLAKLTAKTAS
jgi:hypothetical protein